MKVLLDSNLIDTDMITTVSTIDATYADKYCEAPVFQFYIVTVGGTVIYVNRSRNEEGFCAVNTMRDKLLSLWTEGDCKFVDLTVK